MLISGMLICTGALLNSFAKAIWMLIIGRMLIGLGVGFCNQSVPLYLSEMTPYKYRRSLNIMHLIMFYALVLFNSIGFKSNASLMSTVVIGFVNFLATVVSILASTSGIDEPSFLREESKCSYVSCNLHWSEVRDGRKPRNVADMVSKCIYVSEFAWSWSPLGWLVPSEIFSFGDSILIAKRDGGRQRVVHFRGGADFCDHALPLEVWAVHFLHCLRVGHDLVYLFLSPRTKAISIEEKARIWRTHRF
ncbi:hypothetical protein K1719_022226 [Acacia pycnantha]|nr:hypothetical protein K1719_022226 [Acacia pycnantha]